MAISAYNNRQVKSKLKAAKIFDMSYTSLIDRLKGIKPHSEIHTNSHRLKATEEETLVKQLLEAD